MIDQSKAQPRPPKRSLVFAPPHSFQLLFHLVPETHDVPWCSDAPQLRRCGTQMGFARLGFDSSIRTSSHRYIMKGLPLKRASTLLRLSGRGHALIRANPLKCYAFFFLTPTAVPCDVNFLSTIKRVSKHRGTNMGETPANANTNDRLRFNRWGQDVRSSEMHSSSHN